MTRSQATPQSSQMIWMEQRITELEKEVELCDDILNATNETATDICELLNVTLLSDAPLAIHDLQEACSGWKASAENRLEIQRQREEQITALTAERDKATQYWQIAEGRCDALQKDADRYRWLRMHTDWFDWDIVVQPHLPADHPAHDYFEVKIDCAIDFVMGNLK